MYIGIYKDGNDLMLNVDTRYATSIDIHATQKAIADRLVRCRYSAQDVEAILCDYLDDDKSVDAERTFRELQNHRKEAAKVSIHVVEYIRSEKLSEKPDGIYESSI